MENVPITTEYIKLQDLLKFAALTETGGGAKNEIAAGNVKVNGTVCLQRGKKLRPGDTVSFAGRELTVSYEN